MNQAEEGIAVLDELRKLGVALAIDDFGTGYSSLSYLKRLPVDLLKIDQSFVREIPFDTDDMAIAKGVIALGHSLQLSVLAEGIETLDQRQFLVDNGCCLGQGYLISRPIAGEDFLRWALEYRTHGDPAKSAE